MLLKKGAIKWTNRSTGSDDCHLLDQGYTFGMSFTAGKNYHVIIKPNGDVWQKELAS